MRWGLQHGAILLTLLSPLSDAAARAAAPPRLAPVRGPIAAQSDYGLDAKTRRSLSGIACPSAAPGPRQCLVVFDEGSGARFATFADDGYRAGSRPLAIAAQGELDLEAATTDGTWYYATGSHAVKRSTCAANPASRIVARFAVMNATTVQTTAALWPILAAMPALNAGKCADAEGLDIEGLAVRGGRLFFGLRGPASDARATVLSVDAEALFAGRPASPRTAQVKVGKRRGIRDMVTVADGFLILAGPDGSGAKPAPDWILLHWDGISPAPTELGTLALAGVKLRKGLSRCANEETKPEAIFVNAESARGYRITILSDGMCDGGPLVFDVPRR